MKMAGMAQKVLEMVIPLAGSSSPLGQTVMKALKEIGAHVPPGAVTPADMQNMIQQLIMRQAQFGKNMQMMRQRSAQPQQAAQPAQAQPQPAPQMAAA